MANPNPYGSSDPDKRRIEKREIQDPHPKELSCLGAISMLITSLFIIAIVLLIFVVLLALFAGILFS